MLDRSHEPAAACGMGEEEEEEGFAFFLGIITLLPLGAAAGFRTGAWWGFFLGLLTFFVAAALPGAGGLESMGKRKGSGRRGSSECVGIKAHLATAFGASVFCVVTAAVGLHLIPGVAKPVLLMVFGFLAGDVTSRVIVRGGNGIVQIPFLFGARAVPKGYALLALYASIVASGLVGGWAAEMVVANFVDPILSDFAMELAAGAVACLIVWGYLATQWLKRPAAAAS